jgi:hypothetical protein
VPDVTDHVYPGLPPVALKDAVYSVPTWPPASVPELMLNGVVETVIDSCTDAVCAGDPLSLTDTVNVALPAAVSVPEITPLDKSVSPAGRFPEVTDHV